MSRRSYRLRMGSFAERSFRSSKRHLQQRLWLRYRVMRLGCHLGRFAVQSNTADTPVQNESDTRNSSAPAPVQAGICREGAISRLSRMTRAWHRKSTHRLYETRVARGEPPTRTATGPSIAWGLGGLSFCT